MIFLLQKSKIASIGGKSYAHKTRNIIKFILIDNVCQILSWTGKKEPIAIKDTVFANIILDKILNCNKTGERERERAQFDQL